MFFSAYGKHEKDLEVKDLENLNALQIFDTLLEDSGLMPIHRGGLLGAPPSKTSVHTLATPIEPRLAGIRFLSSQEAAISQRQRYLASNNL